MSVQEHSTEVPHAANIVIGHFDETVTIHVGIFPTLDAASTASIEAVTEACAALKAEGLNPEVTTRLFPAPENWKDRLTQAVDILKEENQKW